MLVYYKQSNDWSPCQNFKAVNLTDTDLNYFIPWSDKLRNIIMNLEFKHIYMTSLLLLKNNYIIMDIFNYIITNYIHHILFKPKNFDIVYN